MIPLQPPVELCGGRRSRLFVFGLCALLFLDLTAASAAAKKTFRIANWTGGSYFNDQTKQFERCAASFSNPPGTTISYSINGQYQWRLIFSNDSWSFGEGYSQSTFLAFGERNHIRARAVVVDARSLEVQTDEYLSLFAALWSASRLQVTTGGLQFEFDLINSSEVLSTLLQCVSRQTGLARRASTGRSAIKSVPNAKHEAKAIATEMLAYAQVTDIQFLSFAGDQSTAAWKTGLVTSGIDVLEPIGTNLVENVPSKLLESEFHKCRSGFFFAWGVEEIDQATLVRSFAACQTPDGSNSVYQSAVPRPKGGLYLLSSRASGSGFRGVVQQQLSLMDTRLRSSLMLAVNKVNREDAGGKSTAVGTAHGAESTGNTIDMVPPGRD